MGKWCNYRMKGEPLRRILQASREQNHGTAQIYTVLNHVSDSGMTRYISAYVPLVADGKAEIMCIARERRVSGCGMDMGFGLAYNMYYGAFGTDDSKDGSGYGFSHHWL